MVGVLDLQAEVVDSNPSQSNDFIPRLIVNGVSCIEKIGQDVYYRNNSKYWEQRSDQTV